MVTYVQALVVFHLLLVDYAETEINLIGFVEVWRHAHDLRESLFGMVQGSIAVV